MTANAFVFTIEIGGTPTLTFEAQNLREAHELCHEQWLKDDLAEAKSDGVPLWDGKAKLRARIALPEESVLFAEAKNNGQPSDGMMLAGAILVAAGFIGLAFHRNRNVETDQKNQGAKGTHSNSRTLRALNPVTRGGNPPSSDRGRRALPPISPAVPLACRRDKLWTPQRSRQWRPSSSRGLRSDTHFAPAFPLREGALGIASGSRINSGRDYSA